MSRSFVHAAFILMAAAGVNRIIGFVYQAITFRMIGPEGVGLFNLVYPVYILILVVATAGIPLGISKLVSEEEAHGNHRKSYQILWLCLTLLIVSGALFSIAAYVFSPLLAKHVFINKKVVPVFLALIPGIFIISVSSAFRGFFQGMMDMKPPAVSQVAEQVVRVLSGMTAATLLLPLGIQWAAAGIAAASMLGEFFGLLTLLSIFLRKKPRHFSYALPGLAGSISILERLTRLCAPITIGRVAAAVMLSVDSFIIPIMLKKSGLSTEAATAAFGQLTGVALTLLNLPSVITLSLATSLVPAISEGVALNKPGTVAARTSEAVRITLLAGLPFITVFLVIPAKITGFIYGSAESGSLLQILALGGLFAYFQQTTTGILQGLGKPVLPLQNMIAAAAVKIVLIFLLTPQPALGILGTAWSYVVFFAIAAWLNLHSLYKKTRFPISVWHFIGKPVFAASAAGLIFYKSYQVLFWFTENNSLSTIGSVLGGFIFYLFVLILLGAITKKDLSRVPMFRRFI